MHNCVRDSNGNTLEIEWKAGGVLVRAYSAAQLDADEVGAPVARLDRDGARWLAEALLDAAGFRVTIGDADGN